MIVGVVTSYYPLVICEAVCELENGPVEIVDFPIENGDVP